MAEWAPRDEKVPSLNPALDPMGRILCRTFLNKCDLPRAQIRTAEYYQDFVMCGMKQKNENTQ